MQSNNPNSTIQPPQPERGTHPAEEQQPTVKSVNEPVQQTTITAPMPPAQPEGLPVPPGSIVSHQVAYSNPNGFPMSNGATLHMDLKAGDLANRLVTVGSASRAKMISGFFDQNKETKTFISSRGFVTYTGYYNDVHVSVVAIGMGISMMDFFVRESRAIIDGPCAMIRFGTCGGIAPDAPHSKIALANKGSGYIIRNPDAFTQYYYPDPKDNPNAAAAAEASKAGHPYHVANLAPADEELSNLLGKNLRSMVGEDSVVEGCNVTADSFYCSQGRIDDRFHDDNANLISKITQLYPHAKTMEMETFTLFHLAKCCTLPIKAAAATIIVANRLDSSVIEEETIARLEDLGGHAVLKTVSEIPLH